MFVKSYFKSFGFKYRTCSMIKYLKNKVGIEQGFVFVIILGTILAHKFYYTLFHKVIVKAEILTLLNSGLDYNESIFFKSSLLLGFLVHYPIYGIGYLLACSAYCIYFRKSLGWKHLQVSKVFVILIFCTALIFVFNNGLSAYNYFTQQWYLLDRLVLVFAAFLLLFTPYALMIYIPVVFLFFASFDFPFDSYTITDKALPLNVLLFTFSSSILFCLFFKFLKKMNFEKVWLLGCLLLICCAYLAPFLIKVKISPHYFDWFLI